MRNAGSFHLFLGALLPAALLAQGISASQIYTDVTTPMGINVSGLGSGTAWSDLDNDGDQDLLVSNSSYSARIYLYRNDGSSFTDVTAAAGITGEARNFAVGDYDNDGCEDLALISFGYLPTRLLRNLGGLQFQDVSATAGIYGTYCWRSAWIDYDDDGLLDLYTCGSPGFLFRNRGDGTFEECAAAAGIQTGGRSCAWLDYDNDGREDCYVGRSGANLLYRNRGDGTFQEVGATAGVNDPNGTSGVCAGDFDGDGFFDLYSVNIGSPSNRLYRNLGNGTFQEITASAGVGDVGDGRTATFLDIDYDGLVDIFSSNHVHDNRLYRNNGNLTFTDIAPALHITDPPDPFGTGFADYDNDGDLDVFLATHFGNRLLRCDGVTNHWIHVRLIGAVSNRSAIGAVVRCTAGEHTVYMRVDGGHGMGDTDSPALEFGLGAATGSVHVTVFWPSGAVETWTNLAPDSQVTLVEHTSAVVSEPGAGRAGDLTLVGIAPNPAGESCTLRLSVAQPGCESVHIAVLDPGGRLVWRRTVAAANGIITTAVPLNGLAAGNYFVQAYTGRATATRPLTIVR